MSGPYQRALVKLSGEALMGDREFGIDPATITDLAQQVTRASREGVEVAIVVGGGNFWRGQIRMLAIYKQALSEDQIRKNFLAGVGKRVILGFDVSSWTGVNSDLEFSVTELDAYSYLFCQPTFVGDLHGIRGGRYVK